MTWRIVRNAGSVLYYNDLGFAMGIPDSDISTGKPGYGARNLNTLAGDGFASISLGRADRTSPAAINAQSVASSVAYNQVDLQWQGAADGLYSSTDNIGSGVFLYQVFRYDNTNGMIWLGNSPRPTFTDTTVQPNTQYTYSIGGIDYHFQYSALQSFPVHTPSQGGIDPRRTGVRANGAYWGGNGEQIDLLGGNLNFTLPLVRAQGRGGWGVTFALNYNSSNFRKDTAATWKLGRDSGYGFGWKFLAGSITAYYSDWVTVDHYLFTDSTGAEYRLNSQSKEGLPRGRSLTVAVRQYAPLPNRDRVGAAVGI